MASEKIRSFFYAVEGASIMPRRPKIPCKHPGCSQLVPHGTKFCEEHEKQHQSDARTTKEKGYNGRWRKARERFLKQHPLCIRCMEQGKYVQAKVVDHIIPHRGDQHLFWDENNWQPLCKSCHDRKTMTEDRYFSFKY